MKNILIYCRESRDDGFLNYERIETQRDILVKYCENKNLGNIAGIILDDNKSGTDFERLNPIKERIANNEIDILLMKDASRLGRNILESLTFTAFLDKHNTELMFESERYDEDMFPLIAWFNERRAKDDSSKIRRVLRHKMETGEMIIKAPYGYIKNDNILEVDEKTAGVVREIFELYIKGFSKREVAEIINKKGCPTPSQLKSQYANTGRAISWNGQHIERILNHLIYTGDMPYGMRKKISFKSKKYQSMDKKDWIIVPNHHAAIISKEIFEEAQSKMQKRPRIRFRNAAENLFSGLLFCGGCGSRFYRKTQSGKSPWYFCSGASRGCSSHRVRELILIEAVRDYIDKLINAPELKDEVLTAINGQDSAEITAAREIQDLTSEIEKLKSKASKIYDDKLEGKLPEYLFSEKLDEITKSLDILSGNLEKSQQDLKKLQEAGQHYDGLPALVELIQTKGINRQVLSLLFDKIIVFGPKEIGPEAKSQFNISDEQYNYLSENGGIVFVQNFIFLPKD